MPNTIITDFSAGEASPRMEGRVDLELYRKSCRTLQNTILHSCGGADRRPGTKYIAGVVDNTKKSRLIEFEYASTKSFLLELANNHLRIYEDDAVHTNFATPSWVEAELFEIDYAQTGAVMYFTHKNWAVHRLTITPGTPDTFALSISVSFTSIAFTTADNRPSALTFHERRLLLGFTGNDPMAAWGSMSPDDNGVPRYENFTLGTTASDAWKYEIAADKGDEGKWLLSHRDLIIGTFGSEYNATGYGAGITPTNVFIKRQSNNGSKKLKAFLVDDAVVYVRRGGKKIMEQMFTREGGGYNSMDLTFFADHIADDGVVDASMQTVPDTVLWYITENGDLIGITYNREFQVSGWHHHVTDGTFESVAVLDSDGEDVIYAVVNRTIGGDAKRYIEKFQPRVFDTHADAFFVDSGITWDGGDAEVITAITKSGTCEITITSSTFVAEELIKITGSDMVEVNGKVYMLKNKSSDTFDLYTEDGTAQIDSSGFTAAGTEGAATKVLLTVPGLTHLIAETVTALRDGAVQSDMVVDGSGEVVLTRHANRVHIGLPYTSILAPMKLAIAPGEIMRPHLLTVRFYETVGCQWGPDEDTLETIPFGAPRVVGQPPELFTGDKTREFPGDWTRDPTLVLVQTEPNPMNILFIIAKVKISTGK